MTRPSQKPELLAPAGDWECLRAAVANGATAVYFGLPRFNARLRAENFQEEDLPEVMKFLHQHGCKGYVTLNVLIFTDELRDADRTLRLLERTGVDAAIIQDVGFASLASQVAPHVDVHGSTQMTITSPAGVAFARKLGVRQVVLARETSLRELAKFSEEAMGGPMPLEVFVHGALCVAYSGQCLTSEALGQRSANRGECAQACRLPYELVVDGVVKDLGDRRYLLSPQDLAAVREIPDLIKLGVRSFKIEGRLKSPEYVAAITQVYRKAIDSVYEQEEGAQGTAESDAADLYSMEMTFSRGLFSGWMHGVNHQKLVHARFGKKRGAFVGAVTEVGRDFVEVEAQTSLAAGDGVCFDTGEDTDNEQGGRIYEIRGKQLYFQHGKIDFDLIRPGHLIWKTDDPQLNRKLQQSFEGVTQVQRIPLTWKVFGCEGKQLKLEGVSDSLKVEVLSAMPLQKALKQPLDAPRLHEMLSRLGETPFFLEAVENHLEGEVILPVSEMNRLRRTVVEQLLGQLVRRTVTDAPETLEPLLESIRLEKTKEVLASSSKLVVLCRNMEQIEAAIQKGIYHLYADFEDVRRYKDGVAYVRQHPGFSLYLATPRIQKAGEEGFFRLIENCSPDGVLVRNLGAIEHFKNAHIPMVGDFSLNVANPLTVKIFMEEGLQRLTPSYDLNLDQLQALVRSVPSSWFELTLHQHMPMFHMEHCVFAAFLSEGTDYTNCGRPCESHQVKLRDRVGAEHPLKADVGCRNTVFHGKAQSGAEYFNLLTRAGLRTFRIELLNETRQQTIDLLTTYQDLLEKKITPKELITRLEVRNQLGVTGGTFLVK